MDKTENSETMYEELEAQNRAANVAYFVSFGMLSAVFLVRYIKLKRKHEFWIFISYVFFYYAYNYLHFSTFGKDLILKFF